MSEQRISSRIDLLLEIAAHDEEDQTYRARLKPDPRRYDWIEISGERYLYDRLDDVRIPEGEWRKFASTFAGRYLHLYVPQIDDAIAYVQSRKDPINRMLQGQKSPPTFADKSEDFLESLSVDELEFVILSLDMVGSTKLATSMDAAAYSRLVSTVLFELSEAVPKFRGHVLKYTGDGLIAYFPAPSFIGMHDLAIQCALTLHALTYHAINPVLQVGGYPEIDIRIGLESGVAFVETIGSPETKQHRDIIGRVVSLATKIQAEAEPGAIFLGHVAQRHLHTMWRLMCEPVKPGPTWKYKDPYGRAYKVYELKLGETSPETIQSPSSAAG